MEEVDVYLQRVGGRSQEARPVGVLSLFPLSSGAGTSTQGLRTSLSMITRVHFPQPPLGDDGCLLQFEGAAFSLVQQHPRTRRHCPDIAEPSR